MFLLRPISAQVKDMLSDVASGVLHRTFRKQIVKRDVEIAKLSTLDILLTFDYTAYSTIVKSQGLTRRMPLLPLEQTKDDAAGKHLREIIPMAERPA